MPSQDFTALFERLPDVVKTSVTPNFTKRLFSNYICKVEFSEGVVGRFGYGSLFLARDVNNYRDNRAEPYAFTVGNFCETAGCNILLGGEHSSHLPINTTLEHFPQVVQAARAAEVMLDHAYSKGPVTIGHNVVISMSAIVLSGVTIGNGALIGAGAVVASDVPDFAVVGGVPGKVIKYRFDEKTREAITRIRWWDLNLSSLAMYYPLIQKLPDPAALEELLALDSWHYRPAQERAFVFKRSMAPSGLFSFEIAGADIDGIYLPREALPDIIRAYLDQAKLPQESRAYLVPDIFALAEEQGTSFANRMAG